MKVKTPILLQSDVIYRLQCTDCSKFYIGQTSQMLKNRLMGHRSDTKYHPERCMLAFHVNNEDHRINYDEVKILDVESNYLKRSFLEMYHIQKTDDTINKRTDTRELSALYTYLMNLDTSSYVTQESLYQDAITFCDVKLCTAFQNSND